jgi:hypothetical protein
MLRIYRRATSCSAIVAIVASAQQFVTSRADGGGNVGIDDRSTYWSMGCAFTLGFWRGVDDK